MSYEIRFIAPSGVAAEVVKTVGDLGLVDCGSWILHCCYISPLKAVSKNEIKLREREIELERQDPGFQVVDINGFSKELEGVDMDEMGLCGYAEPAMVSTTGGCEERMENSSTVSICLFDGLYWTVSLKDSDSLIRTRVELERRIPNLKFE